MEVVFKILHFLCILSVTISFQLIPSMNIKTPIGLQLGIDGVNRKMLNNINSSNYNPTPHNQCFCLPNNAKSRPVISYLDPRNDNLKRKVVYLYKNDGLLKVYIPNKNKQDLIPELNFDGSDGDILKPVTSESLSELFNIDNKEPQQTIITYPEDIINESDNINVETHSPQLINMEIDNEKPLFENSNHLPVILSDDNNALEYNKPYHEENIISSDSISSPSSHVETESIRNPESNQITFLDDTDNLHQIISMLPSKPQTTGGQGTADNNDKNIFANFDDVDQLQNFGSILSSKPEVVGSEIASNNNDENEITNFDSANQFYQAVSTLPSKPEAVGSQIVLINKDKKQNMNLNELDPIHQVASMLPLKPEGMSNLNVPINNDNNHASIFPSEMAIDSQDTTYNSHPLNMIPGLDTSSQLSLIPPLLPSIPLQQSVSLGKVEKPSWNKNQNLDDSGHSHQIPSTVPPKSLTQVIKSPGWFGKVTILDDLDQPILSYMPPKPPLESPLNQNPFITDSMVNKYLTFYQWFEDQLTRVLIYNLETPSKIVALRERIKKVLQDNGMRIGVKGIVIDSYGNLVQMNKIKLRPILIGNHVDSENFSENFSDTAVSYFQLIEIIVVDPPKLLGALVMGTVYLPRNVNGAKKVDFNDNKHKEDIAVPTKYPQGCVTCKQRFPHTYPYSFINGIRHRVPYGQYLLPFRRNFNFEKPILIHDLSPKEETIVNTELQRRVGDDVSRNNGLGGVLEGLLGNLGITPSLFANPSRRLLGGRMPTSPKPGPKIYSNDLLPGYRIIGGNPATSSGTPLVSKGRSGFEKPSLII